MNISTQQLANLVRQYPEFFKKEELFANQRYGQKLLNHLTTFTIEQNGEVNNENFVHYIEQQKDFEKGELAKIKQSLESMPEGKNISDLSKGLYATVILSGEPGQSRDKKLHAAIAQAMFVLGAHYAAALMAPQPPLPVANKVSNLSQLSSVDTGGERTTWSRISADTGSSEASMDQPQIAGAPAKTDLRKRKSSEKNIAQQYSAAQDAAQQQQTPQQAMGRRRKKKKSLMWRLAKITGGATAVGFGGGLFWAGTSQAASVLTDFILK